MDQCFVPCGCDTRESVTTSDLDRFTDKVENVVNNEKGKKLFRNFMRTCNMKYGCRKLDLLEDIDKIINKNVATGHEEANIRSLLKKAEKIQEFDFALMEKMYIARSSENKKDMEDALLLLKTEAIKNLKNEHDAFKKHYTPSK